MIRRIPRYFTFLVLALAVLDGLLLALMHRQGERALEQQLAAQAERMLDIAAFSTHNVLGMLRPLAAMIAEDGTNRELVNQAMHAREWGDEHSYTLAREVLRGYVLDGWNAWQSEQHFRQLHFVLADGSSLLRMHKPDVHGDDLTDVRPMIMYSMAHNTPAAGYEFGKMYGGYRAVAPITELMGNGEKRVTAAVEVGLSGESVFHAMAEHFGIQTAIILHEDIVKSRQHPTASEQFGAQPMEACRDCYLDASTDAQIGDIVQRLPSILNAPTWQLVHLEQQSLLVATAPLRDYRSQTQAVPDIGRLIHWQSVDSLLAQHRQAWDNLLLTNLLSLSLILIATLFITRRTQGWLETRIERQTAQIRKLLNETQAQINIDPLTMCYNRRYLYQRIEEQLALRARHDGPGFALLMIDVDHFKEVNDRWGHLCGDEVLRQIAQTLTGLSRTSDICARYGGEEFCILLPNSTRENAYQFSERIRLEIIALRQSIECAKGWPIAVSIGIAEFQPGDRAEDILGRADQALYTAKNRGRNRVVIG
ncbi:MAG: diguanylate cyclase [Pseudomonadota bacterium]